MIFEQSTVFAPTQVQCIRTSNIILPAALVFCACHDNIIHSPSAAFDSRPLNKFTLVDRLLDVTRVTAMIQRRPTGREILCFTTITHPQRLCDTIR